MAKLLARLGEVNAKIVAGTKGKSVNWANLGALFSAEGLTDQGKVELRDKAMADAKPKLAADEKLPDSLSIEAHADDLMLQAKSEMNAEFGKDANYVAATAKGELAAVRKVMDAADVMKIGNRVIPRGSVKDVKELSSIDWNMWATRLPKAYVEKMKATYDSFEPPKASSTEEAAIAKMKTDMEPLTKEIDALQAQIKAEMADIQKTQASLMKRNAQYYGHTPIEQLLDEHPDWAERAFKEIEDKQWDPDYDPASKEEQVGWPKPGSDAEKYFADSMPR
jgi:hypothetical protein